MIYKYEQFRDQALADPRIEGVTGDYDEARRRGKAWGDENGFVGVNGGWIYTERARNAGQLSRRSGMARPYCQGWAMFYFRNARRIEQARSEA